MGYQAENMGLTKHSKKLGINLHPDFWRQPSEIFFSFACILKRYKTMSSSDCDKRLHFATTAGRPMN